MRLPIIAPLATGRVQGAMLGNSLAACRFDGFVAGAPGDNSVLFLADGGSWLDSPIANVDGGSFGIAVACDGPANAVRIVTAGDVGTWDWMAQTSWNLVDGAPIESLETGPLSTTPLLLGSPRTGSVSLQRQIAGGYMNVLDVMAGSTYGSALVWDRAGTFFVVGDAESGRVRFYGWEPMGSSVMTGMQLNGPPGFGAALAIGDVHPNPGAELIIGAPASGQVYIYGVGPVNPLLLMVLDSELQSSQSFGLSLAVEPNVAGGLGALWVGDPLNDRVVRFVGDAGEPVSAAFGSVGSYFGFSTAIRPGTLMVGAPFFSDLIQNSGAIFSVALDGTTLGGAAMRCNANASCITPTCEDGMCVGGVVCLPSGAVRCDASRCFNGICIPSVVDAGTGNDAGIVRDAGMAVDAGNPDHFDAGTKPDAGEAEVDGGPPVLNFSTSGCSSLGAMPLMLLSLLLGRRRSR